MRVGFGYDVHRLVSGRKLIIGGAEIPYYKGLLGHSDADVLLHAISDALLGSIGEGDIGKHFPDTNPEFKDISSLKILSKVNDIIKIKRVKIRNIDSTIVAQEPKLLKFIPDMIRNISKILEMEGKNINIKAKTTEGLGFIGRGEGIAAYAVVLVEGLSN
jgi:2-C-methyl-D-erythritol 2,4-cyclodiphosphate synthase